MQKRKIDQNKESKLTTVHHSVEHSYTKNNDDYYFQ